MLKSLDDPQTAGLILEEQANALKSILGDASVLKLVRVSLTLGDSIVRSTGYVLWRVVYKFQCKIKSNNGVLYF